MSRILDAIRVANAATEVACKSLSLQKQSLEKIYKNSSIPKLFFGPSISEEASKIYFLSQNSKTPSANSDSTFRSSPINNPLSGTTKRPNLDSEKAVDPKAPKAYSTKINVEKIPSNDKDEKKKNKFELKSSAMPSSRMSRLFHYGALATGVGVGVVEESIKRLVNNPSGGNSLIFTPGNIERISTKLSKMRGAALKLGQMLSLQDNKVLPEEIQQILLRVQNSAHYMPTYQLNTIMKNELGNNWREECFESFDDVPIAAASIGQVHNAVTKEGEKVVVKVQYPGVADSIDSDLNNVMMLLTASRLLPNGLFLDKTVANARVELKWECDYLREASNMEKFAKLLENNSDTFSVPKVYKNISTKKVLTMERMEGIEIVKGNWDQETRNRIATGIMKLCLEEIAIYKFMQTDPNWANFLYNPKTKKIELLDFGSARGFGDEFIKNYLGVLRAAIKNDRFKCEEYSLKLGYLTGFESPKMLNAHVDSIIALGEPFNITNNGKCFDFKNQTVTDRVRGNISTMLEERLVPPPEETYSLHRKLSGAFLLSARLEAEIPCQTLFEDIVGLED